MNETILRNYVKLCLKENLAKDKLGAASQLETAIIDAAKGEEPQHFNTLAKAIAKGIQGDLGYTIPDPEANKPAAQPVSKFWSENGGTNPTPKTDLIIGGQKISLKMGSGQFMSGERGEAVATYMAALEIAGYDASGYAGEVLEKIKKMRSGVEYSMDVSEIRKSSGYAAGGKTKEEKQLIQQEKIQEEIQTELDSILDPESNPELKDAFVFESMSGLMKFGKESQGHADWLLTTAGATTIYGDKKKKGISGTNPKDQESSLQKAFELKRITTALAKKYSDVSIQVKFKSRKSTKGQRSMNDVIGAMLNEAEKFKALVSSKLKKENREIISQHQSLLKEGFFDSIEAAKDSAKSALSNTWEKISSWAQSLWEKTTQKINSLYEYAISTLQSTANSGWKSLIEFLGFELEITIS